MSALCNLEPVALAIEESLAFIKTLKSLRNNME